MSTLRTDTLQTLDSAYSVNILDIQNQAGVNAYIANLLNNTDLTKGAALVGRAYRHINNLAELATVTGRYDNDLVTLERHTAGYNFGGGPWYWDAASVETENNVTIKKATATTTGRWKRLTGSLSFGMFGAKALAGFDNTSALAAVTSFLVGELAAFRRLPAIIVEAGTYEYATASNWGIQGATYLNEGKVKFRNTGTGPAMIFDAGVGNNLTGITFGQGTGFILESGPTATNATVYIRNIYKSEFKAHVWGGGTTQSGFLILGCVLNKFYLATTPTESAKETPADYTSGWYNGGTVTAGKPLAGMTVHESAPGAQSSYNTFFNWLGAACQYGMYLDSTLGNLFLGGDNEFNTITGGFFTANALLNRVRGMNFEVNTTSDVECAGNFNSFDCDTTLFKIVGGSGNRLHGGTHDQVSILGGTGAYVGEIVYGRGLSGNLVIVDNGTKSAFGWSYQAQSQTWSRGPSVTGSITVGASPFTYTNTSARPRRVFLTGGTSVSVAYRRNAVTFGTLGTGVAIELSPGDDIVITYVTTPPTANFITV